MMCLRDHKKLRVAGIEKREVRLESKGWVLGD